MIGWLILACEIGFWVVVLAGLIARYILRQKKLGAVLLLLTPVIDILLLVFTVVDLNGGAKASFFHGLAAAYIGVTIAYGHSMIRWADERFAYRFAGGAAPKKAAKYGQERARRERLGWYRHLLAWAIGMALLYGIIWIVGRPEQTEELSNIVKWWSAILAIDAVISFSYTLWPKNPPKDRISM